jgi:hypothetical protein
MPPGDEINQLLKTSGEKINGTEVRERWLESNPGKKESDYNSFAASEGFKTQLAEVTTSVYLSRIRSEKEKQDEPGMASADFKKLNLKPDDLFSDGQAKAVYAGLSGPIDEALKKTNPQGAFDDADNQAFGLLLDEAKVRAQRNATQLGTELGFAMTLAGKEWEVAQLKGIFEYTELSASLENLKTALKEWNTLLANDALPDADALRAKAKECADKLALCYEAHGRLMTNRREEMPASIKYQLLASMRAIGEKVASQYVARAGKPSLTAMYKFLQDVPNRSEISQRSLGDLLSVYPTTGGGFIDLAKAWRGETKKLAKDLTSLDPDLAFDLNQSFLENKPVVVNDLLADWGNVFHNVVYDPSLDELNYPPSKKREIVAKIAFGLNYYKETVDAWAEKFRGGGKKTGATSDAVKNMRDRYQQTFDSFVQEVYDEMMQIAAVWKVR